MKNPCEILNSTQADRVIEEDYPNVSPSDLATKARKVIRTSRVRTLPVLENRKLKGILSSQNILRITSTHSNIEVSGIMEPPALTGTSDWTLAKLAKKSIEFELYDVPMVKMRDNKYFLGMVRIESILKEILEYCEEEKEISEIMTEEVITTDPEDSISKVWGKMEESNISGFPVIEGNKPIGIITRMDIIKSGKARLAQESERGRDPPKVKTIMTTPIISGSTDDTIKDVLKIMINRNIGRYPVTKNEKLIGIVDRENIIRLYV